MTSLAFGAFALLFAYVLVALLWIPHWRAQGNVAGLVVSISVATLAVIGLVLIAVLGLYS